MPKPSDKEINNMQGDISCPAPITKSTTLESTAYLQGLYHEFHTQVEHYSETITELRRMEAKLDLVEKTVCLYRDTLQVAIATTEDAKPRDWNKVLRKVRFVGIRLADACAVALQDHKELTPEQLLEALNTGMFRFRTSSPLREIHAALMRHPHVEKRDGQYVWTAPAEEQISMRLRMVSTADRNVEVVEELTAEAKEA